MADGSPGEDLEWWRWTGGPNPDALYTHQPTLTRELISPARARYDFLCFLAQCLTDPEMDPWRIILVWQAKTPAPLQPAGAGPQTQVLPCQMCVALAKFLPLS